MGSTSLTLDASGNKIGEMRYYPYGETRYGSVPTDRRFTGQRQDSYINLYEMGARWYDPTIGRWLSPDTIVPDPQNPQSLNRFSYVSNNPINRIDPSGHCDAHADHTTDPCWKTYYALVDKLGFTPSGIDGWEFDPLNDLLTWVNRGVGFEGAWDATSLNVAKGALNAILAKFHGDWDKLKPFLGLEAKSSLVYDDAANLQNCGQSGENCADAPNGRVHFLGLSQLSTQLFLHETGHIVDWWLTGGKGNWSKTGLLGLGWSEIDFGTLSIFGVKFPLKAVLYDTNLNMAPGSHATILEDFADNFAWWTLERDMNSKRQQALDVALGISQ